MFSKVTFLLIITILGVSILQDWKVFYQRNLNGVERFETDNKRLTQAFKQFP